MTAHVTTPESRARFAEAASFVMTFGMHKCRRLDDIAATNRGLGYLCWLRTTWGTVDGALGVALRTYLDDPAIADAVASMDERRW